MSTQPNEKSKEQVFLFVTHVFSEDIIKEFKKIQLETQDLGDCFILYHAKDKAKINQEILDLPHYICRDSDISKIGYPTYASYNKLIPGSTHFLIIDFYRKHPYDYYWYIEYDVRFTGKWKDFFTYFNNSKEDLLTCHIRKYEEQKWNFWTSLSHPTEKIDPSKLIRSFNPICRISLPAIKYIDEKHQDRWNGHYELTFPTFLHNAGYKIRDFGGIGQFVYPEDKNKFYIERTSDVHDDVCMRFKDPHLWLFNKPRNKLIHPVKPGEKRRIIKKKIKNFILMFFSFNEEKFQAFKNSLLMKHVPIPAVGKVRFGDMRRLKPFGNNYGYERGGPVDRYYIENFLKKNSFFIKGHTLEIKDDTYTKKFGGNKVEKKDILDINSNNPLATIIADLSNADHVPSNTFDCIILTQTLQYIYDLKPAIKHVYRMLKPGGVLLLTVPGITRFKYTEHKDDWYWSFTEASVKKLLKEAFMEENIKIEIHGNVLVSTAFLYCMGSVELAKEEYDYLDQDFQFHITAKVIK